jgi:type I restriction enzyme R subunit
MLVAGSIYEACKFYELFAKSELKGKCAIVTSYAPSVADTKGETTGAGGTDNLIKYGVYAQMLADWFNEPAEKAINKVEQFEKEVKKTFLDKPGQMKLLIVVDKLLTGFDAPSATYLYIDKQMRDHGLFQAICRVNRLDGDDKEYGYIIDYKDLFQSLEGAVGDYTSGALDGYDQDDVKGLLENRLVKAREDLEDAREAVKALCEPVAAPRDSAAYLHYFCAIESGNAEQLKDNEPRRLKLYKFVAGLIRAYAGIANELADAGYKPDEIEKIKSEVDHYSKVRDEVRLASGDYIDLKAYEPAMRHLIDTYIRAEDSEKISAFDDLSLIQLIVERGPEAAEAKLKGILKTEESVAETIENNVRKLIINESPVDPAYYEKMSKLLDALIELRRKGVVSYKEYLERIAKLTKEATMPGGGPGGYPGGVKTAAQRALYNNLGRDEGLALAVDAAIMGSRQDGWKTSDMKLKKVRNAIRAVLNDDDLTKQILELAKHQSDY